MRRITTHQSNECNNAITLEADPLGTGGASHNYRAHYLRLQGDVFSWPESQTLSFQDGPIKEVGTNGITHEVLLAIIIDRLEGFQAGQWSSPENAEALEHARACLEALNKRTRLREDRGVEGTHEV